MSSFKDTRPKTQRPAGLANQQKKQRRKPYPRYVEPAPEVKHLSEQVKADLEVCSVERFVDYARETSNRNLRSEATTIFRRRFMDIDFETCSEEFLLNVKFYFFNVDDNDEHKRLSAIFWRRFPKHGRNMKEFYT